MAGRVAVRPDFDALDVSAPKDAPQRTSDGKPWVRWTKRGDYSGWYAEGSRKPALEGKRQFWDAVFAVACACAGGNVDQAHACGRGILSLGGLGVTARSGFAQALLHHCLVTNPTRYVEVMAPVLHATGVFTKITDRSPSGVAFVDPSGRMLLTEKEIRKVVTLGSDSKWTGPQKDRAQTWVSCCSELLRDERMDRAQLAFAEEVLPVLLTERTKESINWGRHGARDYFSYTREQQALWALALVMALDDEKATESLLGWAHTMTLKDGGVYAAEDALKHVPSLVLRPEFEPAFRERFRTAYVVILSLLGLGEQEGP
jgi:hypothetical protein